MHLEDFDALWPGWTLTSSSDDYSWHQELTGQVFRTWADDVNECRSWIARAIEEGTRANPLASLANACQVRVIRSAVRVRSGVRSLQPSSLDGTFNRLLNVVRDAPLKPARFIDRHGTITPPFEEGEAGF